jgi:glyoxylase-like metal-dependent hydrolase (beta-lactamase superfamily II)
VRFRAAGVSVTDDGATHVEGDLDIAAGVLGRLRGYPNPRFPRWFAPTVVELTSTPYGPFPQSRALTRTGDVTLVPLAGHTPGQLGVVVEDGDHAVLLAGDASYTEDLMLRGIVDGPSPDDAVAQRTHARIRELAAQTPTVYAVAHDPATAPRLAERRAIPTKPAAAAATGREPARTVVSGAIR